MFYPFVFRFLLPPPLDQLTAPFVCCLYVELSPYLHLILMICISGDDEMIHNHLYKGDANGTPAQSFFFLPHPPPSIGACHQCDVRAIPCAFGLRVVVIMTPCLTLLWLGDEGASGGSTRRERSEGPSRYCLVLRLPLTASTTNSGFGMMWVTRCSSSTATHLSRV